MVLTDQQNIIDLTHQNVEGCRAALSTARSTVCDGAGAGGGGGDKVFVELLDWADAPAAERLRALAGGPFDLILVRCRPASICLAACCPFFVACCSRGILS